MKDNVGIVVGIHPVSEALNNPERVEKVFVKDDFSGTGIKELIKKSRGAKIPCFVVPAIKIDKISGTRNNQGVVAIVSPIEFQDIENILPSLIEKGVLPKLFILDGVTDVRNLGAIARTAEFLGFDALVVPSRGSAGLNQEAIKASAGALLRIPICRAHVLKQAVFYIKHSGVKIVGASEKSEKDLWNADLTGPLAVVMGAEDLGISNTILKLCDEVIKVPGTGGIQSLNVSVAAGMMAYEITRQNHS
jgi:23S rRNA (guanosine2251-2'-O)-methyltransferase